MVGRQNNWIRPQELLDEYRIGKFDTRIR